MGFRRTIIRGFHKEWRRWGEREREREGFGKYIIFTYSVRQRIKQKQSFNN